MGLIFTHSVITLFYLLSSISRRNDEGGCCICWFPGSCDCNDNDDSDPDGCGWIVVLIILGVLVVLLNFFLIYIDVYRKRAEQYKIYQTQQTVNNLNIISSV